MAGKAQLSQPHLLPPPAPEPYPPATSPSPPSSLPPIPHCASRDGAPEVFSFFLPPLGREKALSSPQNVFIMMIIISARGCLLSAEEVPGILRALSHLLTHEVS